MLLSWLRGFWPARKRSAGFKPPRARPSVEVLEDRTVPAVFDVWQATGDNDVAGSLPWAVKQVNASNDGVNQITFRGNLGTIQLPFELDIQKNVDIAGPGPASLTVLGKSNSQNPNDWFRIFQIRQEATVTISGLTISNGYGTVIYPEGGIGGGILNYGNLTLIQDNITGNKASQNGGGVYNLGTLYATQVVVSGNSASQGGGIFNAGQANFSEYGLIQQNSANTNGGGVYNDTNGTLTLQGSVNVLTNNAGMNGGGLGGGIFNAGNLTFAGGSISNNWSPNDGGGLYNFSGSANIQSATVSNNTTGNKGVGGGIDIFGGSVTVAGTTISQNAAQTGGGIYLNAGTLTLQSTTISGNTATVYGAGLVWKTGSSYTYDSYCSIPDGIWQAMGP